ncbi:hypothetical protein HUJ04_012047 [Dendroctonus ponderosae]|nr:hypothetical protein HUJ04_012047 [Dendroctonus ponderosae]
MNRSPETLMGPPVCPQKNKIVFFAVLKMCNLTWLSKSKRKLSSVRLSASRSVRISPMYSHTNWPRPMAPSALTPQPFDCVRNSWKRWARGRCTSRLGHRMALQAHKSLHSNISGGSAQKTAFKIRWKQAGYVPRKLKSALSLPWSYQPWAQLQQVQRSVQTHGSIAPTLRSICTLPELTQVFAM